MKKNHLYSQVSKYLFFKFFSYFIFKLTPNFACGTPSDKKISAGWLEKIFFGHFYDMADF